MSELAPKLASMSAAEAEVGREVGSVEVTLGINVAFPDLGDVPADAGDPTRYLSGSVAEIADGIRGIAEAGVGHVMAWLYPLTNDSIARFTESVQRSRT